MSFINPDIGWAIGNFASNLLMTRDHGTSWTHIAPDRVLRSALKDGYSVQQLDMVTPRVGWMLLEVATAPQDTKLLKTVDGGLTWTEQHG